MGTKMKGLLKGLRYISQIFEDDEKEPEMQIGYPTDVKHVAHIGWDGPSVNTPSWMNKFNATPEFPAAPLDMPTDAKEDPAVKWLSEDSRPRGTRSHNSPARDLPELPKSSRRSGTSMFAISPSREKSNKPKHSRQQQSEGASINSPTKKLQDSSLGSKSTSQNLPDIPKKTRRKKSKEKDTSAGGSTRSRLKANSALTYTSPFSDPGSGSGSIYNNNEIYQTSPLPLFEEGKGKGYSKIS